MTPSGRLVVPDLLCAGEWGTKVAVAGSPRVRGVLSYLVITGNSTEGRTFPLRRPLTFFSGPDFDERSTGSVHTRKVYPIDVYRTKSVVFASAFACRLIGASAGDTVDREGVSTRCVTWRVAGQWLKQRGRNEGGTSRRGRVAANVRTLLVGG